MRARLLLASGLALVGVAQLAWSTLALPDGPLAIGGPLLAEGLAFAAAAVAIAARSRPAAAVALAVAALAELAFLLLFPRGFDLASSALGALSVAGPAWMAWRLRSESGGLVAGALLGALGLFGYAVTDLLAGNTLLVPGYFAAVPGWGLVVAAALREAPAHGAPASTAHAGARP